MLVRQRRASGRRRRATSAWPLWRARCRPSRRLLSPHAHIVPPCFPCRLVSAGSALFKLKSRTDRELLIHSRSLNWRAALCSRIPVPPSKAALLALRLEPPVQEDAGNHAAGNCQDEPEPAVVHARPPSLRLIALRKNALGLQNVQLPIPVCRRAMQKVRQLFVQSPWRSALSEFGDHGLSDGIAIGLRQ